MVSNAANLKCDECGLAFPNRNALKKHVLGHHPIVVDELDGTARTSITFKCSECGFGAKSAHDLERHVVGSHGPNDVLELTERSVTRNSSGFSKSLKANSSRNISIVDESFVCECGFSSNTKSGATRHKCHKERLMIKCTFCEKYCSNAGSLKLHMKAKHKEAGNKTVDTNVEPTKKTIVDPINGANKEIELDEPSQEPSQEVSNMIKCDY